MNEWEIFKAIRRYFLAQPLLRAAVGSRFRFVQAEQEETWPYIVVTPISNVHEWTCDTELENLRIQFSIFSKGYNSRLGPEEVTTIHRLLTTAFDDAPLAIVGYSAIHMWRDSDNVVRESEYWHQISDYRLRVQVCV